jgi:hypothetical protein
MAGPVPVGTIAPDAQQLELLGQEMDVRREFGRFEVSVADQLLPPSDVTSTPLGAGLPVPSPKAGTKQSVVSLHVIEVIEPTPAGKEADVHVEPPSVLKRAAPCDGAPESNPASRQLPPAKHRPLMATNAVGRRDSDQL